MQHRFQNHVQQTSLLQNSLSVLYLKLQTQQTYQGQELLIELPMGNEGQFPGLFVGGLSNSKEHQRVPPRQPPIGQSLTVPI